MRDIITFVVAVVIIISCAATLLLVARAMCEARAPANVRPPGIKQHWHVFPAKINLDTPFDLG